MASTTTTNKGWSTEDDDTEAFNQADLAGTAFLDLDASLFASGVTGSRPASPDEGDQYVNTTLDRQEWYDGATWRQNIDNKQYTAKGMLLTASAASTISSLAVGLNDTVLVANSAAAGGLNWSATLAGLSLTSPSITGSPTAAGATWANLGTVTTANIIGGTINGTIIGGASAAAGTFTTITASGDITLVGARSITSTGASEHITINAAGTGANAIVKGLNALQLIQGANVTRIVLEGGFVDIFNGTLRLRTASPLISTLAGDLTITPASGSAVVISNLLRTVASVAGTAGLRVPHGAAPTSPVDGDMWTTTAGLYVRINGGTVGPLA